MKVPRQYLDFHRYVWECSGNDTLRRHLELVTVPLLAFVSILRSQGLQRLTTVVEAHRPLIDALRTRDSETIRSVFGRAAVSPYLAVSRGYAGAAGTRRLRLPRIGPRYT